jgi:serine/threonine protein phosphatase PrpC
MKTDIQSFGETDLGLRRLLNEDSLFFDNSLGLYVVADGMGGQNAGEVASRTAIDVVTTFIRRSVDSEMTWPFGIEPNLSYNGNRLRTAIMLANKRVWRDAESREEHIGMGSTIVSALVEDSAITLCGAGDCRAYRIRQENLEQVTTDDSWVQAAHLAGALDVDQFRGHPLRNIVTKAVGAKESIELDVREESLQVGDLFLLCSDGLHAMLPNARILEIILTSRQDLEKAVVSLITAANDAGGKDNVTALLLSYGVPGGTTLKD